ncbi:hypothetical protein HDV05_007857 [Chytridiales sp. JEL 0842]|nr:hypothetical protein HDV05_007857 [Chytridiales sp. JEL 0842]
MARFIRWGHLALILCLVVLSHPHWSIAQNKEAPYLYNRQVSGAANDSEAAIKEIQNIDGSGNNPNPRNRMWGAANNPFLRKVPPAYGPNQSPNGANRPNARYISNFLFSRRPWEQNPQGISDFLPAWGVSLHLDITVAFRNDSDLFNIPVPRDDARFDPKGTGTEVISMTRSNYIGVNTTDNTRIIPNGFTSLLDGSGLYGVNVDEMNAMRSFRGGLLKSVINPITGEFPPRIVGGRFNGYFAYPSHVINMMPHLTATYTVLFREHNRRARELAQRYPNWDDEKLFQRSRRWVIALIQKITLYFYLPTLTGQQPPPYQGYNSSVDPTIDLFFANIAFRYGHSAINQLVTRIDDSGEPIPDGHLIFSDAFYNDNVNEMVRLGPEPVLRGFATQRDQVIDTKFVEEMRSNLPLADRGGHFDIAAIGIQRARELGLPDYNTCRKAFNLPPARQWSDVTSDQEVQLALSQLYPNIDDADAYVVAFAEDHIHQNSLLGPLQRASVTEQFLRLRDGDRFWFESPGVLSNEELAELRSIDFGTLVTMNTKVKFYPSNPFVAVNASSQFFLNGYSAIQAALPSPSPNNQPSVSIMRNLRLSWKLMDDRIDFVFESNATGWYGFGLGTNMLNADIYFCNDLGNGTFTVWDTWSLLTQPPQKDSSQGGIDSLTNVRDITATQAHSKRVVTFSRPLISNEPFDKSITPGRMDVIFAYSNNDDLVWHGPEQRAHAQIDFFATTSAVMLDGPRPISTGLKVLHGITMYTAFAFIYPLGIFVARYSQDLGRWLTIHQALLSMVTSNVLVTALTAIIGNFGDSGTMIHIRIGYAVIAVVAFTTFLGWFAAKVHHPSMNKLVASIRFWHRFLGFLAYILGLVNGYFGAVDISVGKDYERYLPIIYLATIGITPIGLTIYGEYKMNLRRLAQAGVVSGPVDEGKVRNEEKLPLFLWDDINQRVSLGAKWIVIKGIIYDIENFIERHPGGTFFLMRMIGLDATRYFYGPSRSGTTSKKEKTSGKSLVQKEIKGRADTEFLAHAHPHSRFAEFLLAQMAVGRLRREDLDEGSKLDLHSPSGGVSKVSTISRQKPIDDEAGDLNASMMGGMAEDRLRPISPERFKILKLVSRMVVSNKKANIPVMIISFAFPNEKQEVRFRPGEHVNLQFVDDSGKVVTRSYTPIQSVCKSGLDIMVKMYDGEMTTHLKSCTTMRVRGPINGADLVNPFVESGCWKSMGLIAGGAGITPMLLIIDYHLLNCKRDPVTNRPYFQIHLLYTAKCEEDLFALDILRRYEADACGALSITYMVSEPSSTFTGIVGTINEEIISATMPRPQGSMKRMPSFAPGRMSSNMLYKRGPSKRRVSEYGSVMSSEVFIRDDKNIMAPARRAAEMKEYQQDHNAPVPTDQSNAALSPNAFMSMMHPNNAYLVHSASGILGNTNNQAPATCKFSLASENMMMSRPQPIPITSLQPPATDISYDGEQQQMRQEGEGDTMDADVIVVCGPTMMNISVGDMLRTMGYPYVVTL